MDLYSELEWRELLYDGTEGLREALAAGPITGYIGFADGLRPSFAQPEWPVPDGVRAG